MGYVLHLISKFVMMIKKTMEINVMIYNDDDDDDDDDDDGGIQ
jgi:hypothetical protein